MKEVIYQECIFESVFGEKPSKRYCDFKCSEENCKYCIELTREQVMENVNNTVKSMYFPVFPDKPKWFSKLCEFLYRKTNSDKFIIGWKCDGKMYSKDIFNAEKGHMNDTIKRWN